jgi:hypothetical protein
MMRIEKNNLQSGCVSPKPRKFREPGCRDNFPPSPLIQEQSCHDCVQINSLTAATEGVVAIQVNVTPGCRRDLLDQFQDFLVWICFVFGNQQRQNGRIVITDDGVRNQPCTLVADLDFNISPTGELFLSADLGDCRSQLMVRLDPVLRAMDVSLQECVLSTTQRLFLGGRPRLRFFWLTCGM